jgi:hypothetical protein
VSFGNFMSVPPARSRTLHDLNFLDRTSARGNQQLELGRPAFRCCGFGRRGPRGSLVVRVHADAKRARGTNPTKLEKFDAVIVDLEDAESRRI